MIQFPERQLFCATVGDDVAFGPFARGNERQQATELATTALEMMGLPPAEFSERSPFELSAGQQRRAGMAGVAACSAPFYILDEPTAALDADGLARLESLLAKWQSESVAYLIISHDLDWLAQVTHRVWVMDAGRILFDGIWSDSVQLDPILTSIGFRDPH
jgi:energy-coupling factor transport system ATP-binding protein